MLRGGGTAEGTIVVVLKRCKKDRELCEGKLTLELYAFEVDEDTGC